MGHRKNADFAGDRSDLGRSSAVAAQIVLQNGGSEDLVLQVLEHCSDLSDLLFWNLVLEVSNGLGLDCFLALVPLYLARKE